MSKLRSGIGVAFAENMSGYVAAGESDPVAGERRGRAGRERFRFDLALRIEDLKAFLEAPLHEARIESGEVEWKGHLPVTPVRPGGRVVLYRHDPSNPKRSFFDFVFAFEDLVGVSVEAEGRKVIFDDRRLDAASDLSTVFLTLRSNGAVRGAGITRVSFGDLLSQLQGLEVTGARTQKEKKDALHAFFGFMNGELCRIYRGFPRLFAA